MMHIMKRTQVQIPEPLFEDIRRIAELRGWTSPEPREMGEPKVAPDQWRELLADDQPGT